MDYICNKTIDLFIKRNIIDERKKEIYLYGMRLTIYKIAYALIILSMCLILKRSLFNLVLFYCSYMSIRKYSGGYHAPNIQSCMFIFAITYYLLDWFILLSSRINIYVVILLSIILIYLIFLKSPRDCENKRLNDKEKEKYKKCTVYVSLFWLVILILFSFFKLPNHLTLLYTYFSIYVFLLI